MRYTRHQLLLLLALLVAAIVGLGVRHWRAANPELAARLEQLDQRAGVREGETPAATGASTPTPPGGPRPKLGPSSSAATEPRLDLNKASAHDLSRLPGVGATLARRIVDARASLGPFASIDDLRRISGMGRVKLERLRPLVTVAE